MPRITFDTLKYVERLRAGGVPDIQAKAKAEALRDAMAEAINGSLETTPDIAGLGTEMAADRTDLKTDITSVMSEFGRIEWMLVALIALTAASFAMQFF